MKSNALIAIVLSGVVGLSACDADKDTATIKDC